MIPSACITRRRHEHDIVYLADDSTPANLHLGLNDGAISNALRFDYCAAFDDHAVTYVQITLSANYSSFTDYRAPPNCHFAIFSLDSGARMEDRVLAELDFVRPNNGCFVGNDCRWMDLTRRLGSELRDRSG